MGNLITKNRGDMTQGNGGVWMNEVAGLMFGDMTQGNGGVWMTGVAG
jgi:hypothetical protein